MILDEEKTRRFKSKKQLNHRDRYRIKKQQEQSAQKLIAMGQKYSFFCGDSQLREFHHG